MSRRTLSPTRKPPADIPPNFPQHDLPMPYARLLTLGENEEKAVHDEIAAELKAGDPAAAVAKLAEMAQDETFYAYYDLYADESDYYRRETRMWTPLHAVRVLKRMGKAAEVAIEPLLALLDTEDDALREEMPFFYAAMGAPAVEPLVGVLNDADAEVMWRGGACDSLDEIAEAHPELRGTVIAHLEQALVIEQEDPTLVGFLIESLMDVGARESLPLIMQAFADGRVDEMYLQQCDVEEHFGLPITKPRKKWLFGTDMESEGEAVEIDYSEMNLPSGEASEEEKPGVPYVAPPKVGRNEPCPCGSGKKYKKCCGA